MLYKRNQLYKRKIISGSIFGNLFSSAKRLATTATKTALKNASQQASNALKTSNVKTLLANKVKEAAKQQFGVSNLAEAKKLALDTAKAAAAQKVNQLGEDLAQTALSRVSKLRLPPAVKDTINPLGTKPKVKRALTRKSKETLSNLLGAKSLTDSSRAIMSNILAGSGVKRIG